MLSKENKETYFIIFLAMTVGILGGLFSVLFRKMIFSSGVFFKSAGESLFGFMSGHTWVILLPAMAGILVGPLTYFLAREAKGHGVPEVMEAAALRGGRMRMRVIFVKAIASAASIGSGASVGREGPIIQMGSGIGSVLAQHFKLREDKIKTCLACGSAAGISATFNAPLAGAIFAQEVILGKFTSATLIPVVIASVAASVVGRIFSGDVPAFLVEAYRMHSPNEIFLYVLLGILAALVATIFVRLLYRTEDFFDGIEFIPPWSLPVFGGLIIGATGYFYPEILGVGYGTIENIFSGNYSLYFLFVILILKIIITSVTLGSGHSGGVFAPSLFMGASLGGMFGIAVNGIFPGMTGSPAAYAIVGMGAVVAGTTQGPIAAVLIIFEMTQDYKLILPLMVSVVISTLGYSILNEGSIYTTKLLRRGINIRSGMDVNILKKIFIRDIMNSPVETVSGSAKVGFVIKTMHKSKHNGFPVVDEEDRIIGMITLDDVRNMPVEGIMEKNVSDYMSRNIIKAIPSMTVYDSYKLIMENDIGHLPITDDEEMVVGMVTRSDLVKSYERALLRCQE